MPFTTTTTVPSINATVTIRFAGLMLLKPGAGNTCEVGIHRFSPVHTFQALLIVNKPNLPLTFIHLIKGPLTTAPLSFDVLPAPAPGFSAFAQEPFGRNNPQSHLNDHRWALNIREFPAHANADFNDGARPVAILKSGILYTGNLTRPGLNPQLTPVVSSGPTAIPLHRGFAADLAVAIDIPPQPNAGLFVRWEENGEPKHIILPRPLDVANHPGTTYTIALMNDPPAFDPLPHDELGLYYKVLRVGGNPIPVNQQFRVTDAPGQTDEIPCMPVTLNP